jgi:hypothetical protein
VRLNFRRATLFTALTTALATALAVLPGGVAEAARRPIGGYAFGTHYLNVGKYPWPATTYGTLRIWDDGASWRDLQPGGPGSWDQGRLHVLDAMVSKAYHLHKQTIIVLGQTPRWASSNPNGTGGTDPRTRFFYGRGAGYAPNATSWKYWGAYVSFLARRYGSHVNAFEVWNEANYPTYSQMTMPQMVNLARIARAAVRQAGSRAAILAPSIGARHPNAPAWMASFLSHGGGRYVDALNVHMYPVPGNGPEDMQNKLGAIRVQIRRYGYSWLPIWDTEVGYGLRSQNRMYYGAQARGYVARTFLVELSNGITRAIWYAWGDRTYSGLYVMNSDGSTSSNGVVERVTYAWMAHSVPSGCRKGGTYATRYIWSCRFRYADGTTGLAWWAIKGAPVVHVPRGARTVQTTLGNRRGITGGAAIRLTQEPVLVRGAF